MRAAHRIKSRFVSQTGTKGSLQAGTKASWAALRFWGDVAGPLVPAQMEAGTKESRPKARFLQVASHAQATSSAERGK
jgi:hypothetical protein